MNNAICGKAMENLGNRISVQLVNNEKDYLKCTSKPSYMSHKMFDNNLVAICKSKLTLKLNKLAYIKMCILELSKVLIQKFQYDYYDSKSKLLFTDTDSLMDEVKTEDIYEDFSNNKKMFDFSNYWAKSKYCDDSNKLVIGKMKDETGCTTIEEFAGRKPTMHSFLVHNIEHKILKGVNQNVVATISYNEQKDVFLSNKCLRHSVNRI